tara:strand:+ start:1745 stop:2110 length:366 start_codon:yes stop_codon:yes gene_type:complete
MAINTELYEQLKKENDKLILKETKTHNDNISLQSKIEELGEIIIGMGSEIKKLNEENKKLLEKLEQKKTKSINRQKYIHYKNIVLKNELGDVSDFEDEDYIGFGEKPYSKSKDFSSKSGSM